jgi:ABC-type transport system substrate-binding protein
MYNKRMGQDLLRPFIENGRRPDQDAAIMHFLQLAESKNYEKIRNRGVHDFFLIIGALAQRKVHNIQDSSIADPELLDAIRAAAAGIREHHNIPNTWQDHLLKATRIIGFPKETVFKAISERFSFNDPSAREAMNHALKRAYGSQAAQLPVE